MKLVFLVYTNIVDHHFNGDTPLETMFWLHHPYSAAEISLIEGSKHIINQYLQIEAYTTPGLMLTPWSPTPENLQLYVNGVPYWKQATAGILLLTERDIIEIILTDNEKEILTHQIIVITSITK